MKDSWKVLLAALPVAGVIAAVVVMLVYPLPAAASHCSGVQITGGDLDAVVNADSSTMATTFCVHAGTYTISEPLTLKNGDKLIGQEGDLRTLGPATFPDTTVPNNPAVKVVAGPNVGVGVRGFGSNIEVAWIDISGAKTTSGCTGTGVGIAAGSTDGTFKAHHNYIHDNYSVGIGNAHGSIKYNEFASNTRNSNCIGNNGAGVKGVTEYEAAFNYVHDEQGNGLWCDRGCDDDPMYNDPTSGLGGFWAHHNVVVNNARGGIRIENSPNAALIENNEIHGNSRLAVRGGVSIRDSQNATVRNNVFGRVTIGSVTYDYNRDKVAVRASDSGRTDRTDLWNVDIVNNTLNNETIKGCELPDNVVYCSGNQ